MYVMNQNIQEANFKHSILNRTDLGNIMERNPLHKMFINTQ